MWFKKVICVLTASSLKIKPMKKLIYSNSIFIFLWAVIPFYANAQTDMDAIMMEKNAFCAGAMYNHSSWKNYWEGTTKRDNQNLGTVSSSAYSVMGNYGIGKKMNILFNIPYVTTKASAGQLKGQKGFQDISLFVKWRGMNKKINESRLAVYGIGGITIPITNYVADYLPLAIGLHSRTALLRLMVDYYIQNKWFVTGTATWQYRNNIKLDRNAYYTDRLILSDEVEMPNTSNLHLRMGYRTQWLIAEWVFNKTNTLGGFDITRNNMPFPSNRMNAASVGVNFKYVLRKLPQLSLTGGAHQVVSGRNAGQSFMANGGIFYVLDFSPKQKK
jgi:hypothetical protein